MRGEGQMAIGGLISALTETGLVYKNIAVFATELEKVLDWQRYSVPFSMGERARNDAKDALQQLPLERNKELCLNRVLTHLERAYGDYLEADSRTWSLKKENLIWQVIDSTCISIALCHFLLGDDHALVHKWLIEKSSCEYVRLHEQEGIRDIITQDILVAFLTKEEVEQYNIFYKNKIAQSNNNSSDGIEYSSWDRIFSGYGDG